MCQKERSLINSTYPGHTLQTFKRQFFCLFVGFFFFFVVVVVFFQFIFFCVGFIICDVCSSSCFSFGALGRLCFVIVKFPGYLHLYVFLDIKLLPTDSCR